MNNKAAITCHLLAALCFGIVSCGSFSHGRIVLGVIFALLTGAQLMLAWMKFSE